MRKIIFLTNTDECLATFKSIPTIEGAAYYFASSEREGETLLKSNFFSVVVFCNYHQPIGELIEIIPDSSLLYLYGENVELNADVPLADELYFDFTQSAKKVLLHKIKRIISIRDNRRELKLSNSIFGTWPDPLLITRSVRGKQHEVIFFNQAFSDISNRTKRIEIGDDLDVISFYEENGAKEYDSHQRDTRNFVIERFSEDKKSVKRSGIKIIRSSGKSDQIEYMMVFEQHYLTNTIKETKLIEKVEYLSSKMQTQAEFLASIAHDIRKPLNNIIGLVDLLEDSELNTEQKFITDSMSQSSVNLKSLINDLLDHSKLDTGNFEISSDFFDLRKFVSNLKTMFANEVNQKGLSFSISVDENLPAQIKGDKNRLSQILINLISNSLKFTENGSISLAITHEVTNADLVNIAFKVKDTGIGINENNLDRIFESYNQADANVKNKFGGTGLGLSICKKLCSLMGGEIGVTSEIDKGSEFWVSLPFEIGQIQAEEQELDEKKDLEASRILVVDDNETTAFVLKKLISLWQGDVTEVFNAKEAIKAFEENEFDLVLTDIHLPDINGLRLAQRLKAMSANKGKIVPVIGISAYPYPKRHQEAGMLNSFLLKPIKKESLFNAINDELTNFRNLDTTEIKKMNYKIIDVEHIKAFTSGDEVFIRQLVEIFLKRTPEYMNDLRKAIEEKDWSVIKTMAHKVKPTFTYVGMGSFTTKVGSMEDFAIKKEIKPIEAILNEVWDDCQLAFDEFDDFVKGLDE